MAASRKTLAATEYRSLLRDIKKLTKKADAAASNEKVEAQWRIGQRIRKLRLSEDAGYHNSVIRDLASDAGLAISTLHQAVRFSEVYKKAPSQEGISWSHYRVLLRVASPEHREFYVDKILKEGWNTKQLNAAVTAGLHEGNPVKRGALERPTEPNYVYSARVLDIIDGDTLDLSVDLGFGVFRELRVRLAVVDTPPPKTPKGRKARDFVAEKLMSARSVAVQTIKVDIYGRYVVHLFYASRRLTALDCFNRGSYLNENLLGAKLAKVVG